MERVAGRKSTAIKKTREFVEQAAIAMANRAYAATCCHITGETHSQLTKQSTPRMFAGTEAAVASVVNDAAWRRSLDTHQVTGVK